MTSGPGFGGSCFKKDILNLVYLCKHYNLNEVANFWESVVDLNDWHQHRISSLIIKKLFGTVSDKKICILGFAFKANTNDTRESASIKICKDLLKEGAILYIHDPKVDSKQISKVLGEEKQKYKNNVEIDFNEYNSGAWIYTDNIFLGLEGADAVVILTEWSEYGEIDWKKADKKMRRPSWVFDTRSIIDTKDEFKNNINLWRIGDGTIKYKE